LLTTVLKLLPSQSKVVDYIRRHQQQRAKKELPSFSRTDVLCDPPTTFSRRAPSSLSMDELSQRATGTGTRSVQAASVVTSPEVPNRKQPKSRSEAPAGITNVRPMKLPPGDKVFKLFTFVI